MTLSFENTALAVDFPVITTDEQWHEERRKGIGGSEAAAIIGLSPWCSNVDLWKRKTGRVTAPDISDNEAVKYGHDAEPLIRGLFALNYAHKYDVEYRGKYDMVRHPKHTFIFSTLDGRITEKATGRRGIFEAKSTTILRSMQKEKWWKNGEPCIPDNYYCQVLWQLIASGFDFAVLYAMLRYDYGEEIRCEFRPYTIERSEVEEDLEFLETKGVEFWKDYVMGDRQPPLILPEI